MLSVIFSYSWREKSITKQYFEIVLRKQTLIFPRVSLHLIKHEIVYLQWDFIAVNGIFTRYNPPSSKARWTMRKANEVCRVSVWFQWIVLIWLCLLNPYPQFHTIGAHWNGVFVECSSLLRFIIYSWVVCGTVAKKNRNRIVLPVFWISHNESIVIANSKIIIMRRPFSKAIRHGITSW